jgi:putative membrane protein
MLTDFLLACLHHLAAFALVAIIACELVLLRPGLDGATAKRIAALDGFYGLAALLLLVAGFGRVFFGAKGGDYYLGSLAFWAKIALFVGIGLLSIAPTLRFLAWRRVVARDPTFAPLEADVRATRRYVHAEAGLLVLLPVLAAAMARGY